MIPNRTQLANEIRARRSANDLINDYFITRPSEIRLEDIAMDRGIIIREGQLNGSEAYLLRRGRTGVIRISNSISEAGRKRFAIAHELGHWEMHGDRSQILYCTEEDISGYHGSPMEIEANCFASELLIPTRIASQSFSRAEPSLKAIKELAETFGTSFTAAAVRFVQLSKENCLVVFSRSGIVQWWRKGNKNSSLPGIERHHPLHPDSEACEVFKGRRESVKMVRIPSKAWFPWLGNRREFEVYEQSVQLGRYPTILTLLWIITD